MQFKVDGQNLGAEDTSAPYSMRWDTRGELNGSHTLTAVARDTEREHCNVGAGIRDRRPTPASRPPVSRPPTASTTARWAWPLVDSSGNFRTATLVGGGWTSGGRFGGAVSFNGTNSEIDLPALGTFYKTGFSLEAWVYKQSSKVDVGGRRLVDEQPERADDLGRPHHRPLPAHARRRRSRTTSTRVRRLRSAGGSTSPRPTTARRRASTSTASLVASSTFTGNVGDSNTWRIGAYGSTAGRASSTA